MTYECVFFLCKTQLECSKTQLKRSKTRIQQNSNPAKHNTKIGLATNGAIKLLGVLQSLQYNNDNVTEDFQLIILAQKLHQIVHCIFLSHICA